MSIQHKVPSSYCLYVLNNLRVELPVNWKFFFLRHKDLFRICHFAPAIESIYVNLKN